jgi:hypothetical protein
MSGGSGRRSRRGGQRANRHIPDALLALKLEAARELGLLEKAAKEGWGSLSAAEAGRIGGYMMRLRKEAQRAE